MSKSVYKMGIVWVSNSWTGTNIYNKLKSFSDMKVLIFLQCAPGLDTAPGGKWISLLWNDYFCFDTSIATIPANLSTLVSTSFLSLFYLWSYIVQVIALSLACWVINQHVTSLSCFFPEILWLVLNHEILWWMQKKILSQARKSWYWP